MASTNKKAATSTATAPIDDPFASLLAAETSKPTSRKLAYTAPLQDKARALATQAIRAGSTDVALRPLAQEVLKGDQAALIRFIEAAQIDISEAATVLDGCPTDDLNKMLESQRSNRSKAKRSGLTAMSTVVNYVASMIAELMIRSKTGKAYNASQNKLSDDPIALAADPDLLSRKIASLASKKSRLSKLAQFDDDAKAQLEEIETELAKLRALRPSKTKTKTVKSLGRDEILAALQSNPDLLAELKDNTDLLADLIAKA